MSDNRPTSAQPLDALQGQSDMETICDGVADAPAVDDDRPVDAASLADDPQEAVVLIELDPGLTGGFIRNRFDITVCGRVASDVPLIETRLQIGDGVTSAVYYGKPERPGNGNLPDASSTRPRAFRFNLPRQPQGIAEHFKFEMIARTVNGLEYAEQFEIDLDTIAESPVSLVSGPSGSSSDGTANRPHVVMYVERGALDADGVLLVQGWAISLSPISAIQIFAGAERVGDASLGDDREDVASAFNGYPNAGLSGFSLTVQLDEIGQDAETIRVQVVCSNGYGHDETIPVERVARRHAARAKPRAEDPRWAEPPPDGSPQAFSLFNRMPAYQLTAGLQIDPQSGVMLAPATDTAPFLGLSPALSLADRISRLASDAVARARDDAAGKIEMYCDEAHLTGDGILSLNGWATCKAGIAQVRVLLDDEDVGLAVYGHERLDVGRIFSSIPMSHLSGFKFERRIRDRVSGQYSVRVIVCNMRNEQSQKEMTVVATALPDAFPGAPPRTAARPPAPEQSPDQAAEFRFELDSPAVTNGAATGTVTGRLTIDGWLLSRSGIAKFEVFLNDQRLGDAHDGLAR
jgi:hypothetical protein